MAILFDLIGDFSGLFRIFQDSLIFRDNPGIIAGFWDSSTLKDSRAGVIFFLTDLSWRWESWQGDKNFFETWQRHMTNKVLVRNVWNVLNEGHDVYINFGHLILNKLIKFDLIGKKIVSSSKWNAEKWNLLKWSRDYFSLNDVYINFGH